MKKECSTCTDSESKEYTKKLQCNFHKIIVTNDSGCPYWEASDEESYTQEYKRYKQS